MIGTYHDSTFRSAEDFKSHKDYLAYMYGATPGYITRNVLKKEGGINERFYQADRLVNHNRYHGMENVFVSMNSFLTWRKGKGKGGRKVSNVKRLNALYIDIDCDDGIDAKRKGRMTKEQALCAIEDGVDRGFPAPTFIIDSGRGLYLIWKINEDRNALPRWKKVQEYLYEQLKDCGADHSTLDAARILRVPFTVNPKNGRNVQILSFRPVSYSLHEIMREYGIEGKTKAGQYPYGHATETQRQKAKNIAKRLDIDLPDFTSFQETFDFIGKNDGMVQKKNVPKIHHPKISQSEAEGRVEDLFTLHTMRKGADCRRENALFLCRMWWAQATGNFSHALEKALELNRSFDVPFTEKYVINTTKSAEQILQAGKAYNYSVKNIVKVLDITSEEQKHLSFLRLRGDRTMANHKAYIAHLKDEKREMKAKAVKRRRITLALLLADSTPMDKACNILNISKRTYYRDVEVVKECGLYDYLMHEKKDAQEIVPFFQALYYIGSYATACTPLALALWQTAENILDSS